MTPVSSPAPAGSGSPAWVGKLAEPFRRDLIAAGLLGPLTELAALSGPRRWWGGPLDVEGLALGAVEVAAAALHELTGARVSLESSRIAATFDSLSHLRVAGRSAHGFGDLSGFFPTADGWIRTHGNYPHHADRLLQAVGAAAPGSLAPALSEIGTAQAEAAIRAHGGVAAAVLPRGEQPEGPWIALYPVVSVSAPLWEPIPDAPRPLRGLRVLDFTRVVAGPEASRMLAALGADVMRVDPPAYPEDRDLHLDSDFGKRTTVIDVRDPYESHRLRQMLAATDVILLGYRPESVRSLGLDPEELAERYPHLVIISLSAWKPESERAGQRGFDSIVQAATGIADRYRTPQGGPGALPVQALDHATGFGMLAATLALLSARRRGAGAYRAALSLEATADLLWALPLPEEPIEDLASPLLRSVSSPYGRLSYVPPPLNLNGAVLDYPFAPRRYGRDGFEWGERGSVPGRF